tara:strand:+ start:398 stop:580 length:183 start_codon:yes stop_codon:yes gene_type:complete
MWKKIMPKITIQIDLQYNKNPPTMPNIPERIVTVFADIPNLRNIHVKYMDILNSHRFIKP